MMRLILFFVYLVFCGEAQGELVSICLKNGAKLISAKNKVKEILHPEDKVFLRESTGCLEFSLNSPGRIDLYNSFLGRFYLLKDLKYSKSQYLPERSSGGNCRFKYTKQSTLHSKSNNIEIGPKSKLAAKENSMRGSSSGIILVTEGKWGSLIVNDTRTYVTCRKKGKFYEVEVSLSQSNSSLSTSLNVSPGQKINLGSVVNSLNNRSSSLSLNKGFEKHKKEGAETTDYYLVLENQ